MFRMFDKRRLQRTREMLRAEQLHELKFSDAFHETLAMMALLIDMTASFTSPSEYHRIPDHCGSLPAPRKPDDKKKKKNSRRRS